MSCNVIAKPMLCPISAAFQLSEKYIWYNNENNNNNKLWYFTKHCISEWCNLIVKPNVFLNSVDFLLLWMWIWNVNSFIYILNRMIFFHKTCSMYYRWMTLFWSMGECGDHRPSCCFTRLSTPWWRCSGHIFIYNIYAYIYYYYHHIYI